MWYLTILFQNSNGTIVIHTINYSTYAAAEIAFRSFDIQFSTLKRMKAGIAYYSLNITSFSGTEAELPECPESA
jgi:hypothetical protein